MKYLFNILLVVSLFLTFNGCAGKEEVVIEESEVTIVPEKIIKEIKHVHHNPFYPLKDKINIAPNVSITLAACNLVKKSGIRYTPNNPTIIDNDPTVMNTPLILSSIPIRYLPLLFLSNFC